MQCIVMIWVILALRDAVVYGLFHNKISTRSRDRIGITSMRGRKKCPMFVWNVVPSTASVMQIQITMHNLARCLGCSWTFSGTAVMCSTDNIWRSPDIGWFPTEPASNTIYGTREIDKARGSFSELKYQIFNIVVYFEYEPNWNLIVL